MTDEEIAVALERHEQQISSLNNRSASLWERSENFMQTMSDLTLAVKELTISMKSSHDTHERIIERLEELEAEPAEKWNTVTKTAVTAIISAIAGAFAIGLVQMIAGNM